MDALDDTGVPVKGALGGELLASVLANDMMGGAILDPTKVTTTQLSSDSTKVRLDGGKVVVDPGLAAGTYLLKYRICESTRLSNCDDATVTATVTKSDLIGDRWDYWIPRQHHDLSSDILH